MGAEASVSKGRQNLMDNQAFHSISNFHPGYIQKLKERFELAKESFTLDKQDLQELFNSTDKEVDIIFEHFDQEKDEVIDQYEFTTGLAFLSHGSLEEKAKLIFQLYDFDKSKYISRDELTILMTNSLTALKAMEKEPAPSIETIEQKTEEFFSKSDIDGNERITLDEFTSFIKKDKQVRDCLISYGIAKTEDLGVDLGAEGEPFYDSDLENEINVPESFQDEKRAGAKYGIDFEVELNEDGSFFEKQKPEAGDKSLAAKPWKEAAEAMADPKHSTGAAQARRDRERPDASLDLEYIYGYRCHDARNNLRYTQEGKIVYHAAGVGVVLNQKENTQEFMLEHDDDILCLATDPTGQYCVTGQVGPQPQLCIWDTASMECLARYKSPLTKGIKNVAFSNDGELVAASGMDDDHSLVVFKWKTAKGSKQAAPLASGKGPSAAIWSLGFSPDKKQLVATCTREVNFYSFDKGVIKGRKGTGWTVAPGAVPCQAFVEGCLFTGTHDGQIVQWSGRSVSKEVKAHESAIYAMQSRTQKRGLITGDKDGQVFVWAFDKELIKERKHDLRIPDLKSMMPSVKSVAEHPKTGQVLVGTRGGEIVEFGHQQKNEKPKMHLKSHYHKELKGLAPHPSKAEFLTVGQDGMLGVWDIAARRQKQYAKLECGADAVAYSNDGSNIAIGMRNGYLLVVDAQFAPVAKTQHSKTGTEITTIRFSPNNEICAVGGQDGRIRLYDVHSKYRRAKVIKKNSSAVTHLDFDSEGRVLMTNNRACEVLFFDADTGKHLTKVEDLRSLTWPTWSCTFGWPVQGIFPANSDGSDVNACSRSPDGGVVATGDDAGRVNLYRYPCPQPNATACQSIGHSAHVANVTFSLGSDHLLSSGGADLCVFQWKYQREQVQEDDGGAGRAGRDDWIGDEDDFVDYGRDGEAASNNNAALDNLLSAVSRSCPSSYAPSRNAGRAPEGNLRLKCAHGFRSHDAQGNLKYASGGKIVYTTAALGVVQDTGNDRAQEFFDLHEDDVVSLAIHPDKDIAATGQRAAAGKAKMVDILVWRISTQEVLARLTGFHRRAVSVLKFSPNGQKLLSIGQDEHHSVAVYDWMNQVLLSTARGGSDKVFDATWKNNSEFMAVDGKQAQFFVLQGKNIMARKGLMHRAGAKLKSNLCASYAFNGQVCLTGNETGEILQWDGSELSKVHKAHSAPVWQILCIENDTKVVSGGADAQLLIWDKQMNKPIQAIDLAAQDPAAMLPEVRSLDFNEQTKTYLVGTRGAEVMEVSAQGKKLSTLVRGHYAGDRKSQLWGAACHPKQQIFATCGADRCIRIWDERQQVAVSEQFADEVYSIDWSPCGGFLAVGDARGQVYSVDAQSLKVISKVAHKSKVPGTPWVQDVKISPNGQYVAFGVHGGSSNIELASIDGRFQLRHDASMPVGMRSDLLHLDWSMDSRLLAVNSQGYELLFVDISQRKPVAPAAVRDEDWNTWTCKFGFPVQGIWPGASFQGVNAVARSHSRKVLATAEDSGLVRLFRYPCTVEKATAKECRGHSQHVTRVVFSADDKLVITVGGHDKTVLVWETDFSAADSKLDADLGDEVAADEDSYAIEEDHVDQSRVQKQQWKVRRRQEVHRVPENELDIFTRCDDLEGDEALAVRPSRGQMKPPSGFTKPAKNQEKAPHVRASVEWVHGYKGHKAKNNVRYLVDGSVAYHAAGLGIVYDDEEKSQRHFDKHTDEITAIAFAPDKRTIATGEVGKRPKIFVWDACSMQVLQQLQGKLSRGVKCMDFSPSGKLLAAVDSSDEHQVAIFNVESGLCVAVARGDKSQIVSVSFRDEISLATAGVKHFKVWTLGKGLTSKSALWGKHPDRNLACVVHHGDQALTGSAKGSLLVWKDNSMSKNKPLHSGVLDTICAKPNVIFTGGRDMVINVLDVKNFDKLFAISLSGDRFNSQCGQPRAIDLDETESKLVVGTFGSEIFEVPINLAHKRSDAPSVITQGHYAPKQKDTNEVWGLCARAGTDQFITVGEDATLRVWSAREHKQVFLLDLNRHKEGQVLPPDPETKELSLGAQARCVDVSADGSLCAVGFRSGQFRVYRTSNWKNNWKMAVAKKGPMKEWLEDIKFSPDNQYLAVSSHDNKVYVFAFPAMEQHCTLSSSTSFISHLDWSADSRYIRTNDGNYEILYYDVSNGAQETNGAKTLRDVEWHTQTCPISWATQGIWARGMDGTDINHCDRSSDPHPDGYQLLAAGDDFGKVKIYRYPSMVEPSKSVVCRGHSSHVTKVKFGAGNLPHTRTVFSTGGNDCTVIQWKLDV